LRLPLLVISQDVAEDEPTPLSRPEFTMTEPAGPAMQTVDAYGIAAERAFADLWSRDVLSSRERRLLLLGLLVGLGLDDQVTVQLDVALRTGELEEAELRELVVFLTHYAGWARGSRLNNQVEDLIEAVSRDPAGRRRRPG
jgi:4-carboxymuconolactone decarboxylase